MGITPRRTRSTALGLAALALGALTTTACSGGGTDAATAPETVTVTSTTSPPSSSSSTDETSPTTTGTGASGIASGEPTPGGEAVTTPTGATSGGATVAAGTDQAASGLPTCQPSQMRIRIEAAAGGGSAGHQQLNLVATNTGSAQCVTQGYPGVSLVAPGTGKQLGAAADRVGGQSTPLMRLEPGKTAVAAIQVAQAGNYGSGCAQTAASGFRIYLPGTTAAAYAPFPVAACATASVHQLEVKPFNT